MYEIGSNINVKCEKDWKTGIIAAIVNGWFLVKIEGYKNLKKVNSEYVNMYF